MPTRRRADETIKKIPGRYLPAEYIQSYGNELINSQVYNFVGFELDFQPTAIVSNGNFAGARYGNTAQYPRSVFLNYSSRYMHCHGDWFFASIDTNRHNFKVIISYNEETTAYKRTCYFDSTNNSAINYTTNGENWWIPNMPCGFCGAYSATSATKSKIKLYSAKVWGTLNSDVLAFNAVPVYDTVTAKYGMWDYVSQSFFGNAGTGAFGGALKT